MLIFATKFQKIALAKSITIRPFIAGVMLLVFAFAITPKRYLHNLLVNHKDVVSYQKLTNGKTEFSKAGFHCAIDNLVATSPFTDVEEKSYNKLPVVFIAYAEVALSLNVSEEHSYFNLRGPPAL